MITRLQVKNFKSLRELDLQLGPINVLVGPNMAGKSNILDVFRFLHDILSGAGGLQGLNFALVQRGGVNEILWKGGKERIITFVLEATEGRQSDTKYKYELRIAATGVGNFPTIQSESLKLVESGIEHDLLVQQQ